MKIDVRIVPLAAVLFGTVAAAEIEVDTILPDRLEAHADEIFRISKLALRDPHVFVEIEPIPGFSVCVDVTDPQDDFPGAPSFNGIIDQSINQDGTEDGFLDVSPLFVFAPLGGLESPGALSLEVGQCTAPAEDAVCTRVEAGLSPTGWHESRESGLCRGPIAGTVRPYDPPVPTIEGPCFATHPAGLVLDLEDLVLDLDAATVAARWAELGNDQLRPALMRGFLTEDAAEVIVFPDEIDVIGGQTLASLLRGGEGNCASGSDKSEFEGVSGWWLYFETEATRPVEEI